MAIALGAGVMLAFGGFTTVDAQATTPTTLNVLPVGSGPWAIQNTPNPKGALHSYLSAVACASTSVCIAVGNYENSAGAIVTLAEEWNGTAWTIQKTPNPKGDGENNLSAVACPSTSACTAVGSYDNSSDAIVTLAEEWNGTAWTIQKTPKLKGALNSFPVLSAVACSSTSACTAVGSYYTNYGTVKVTLAEAWNGIAWTIQKTPTPKGALNSYLYGVACQSTSVCIAVGTYDNGSDVGVTLAEAWNGIAWTIQKTPEPKGACCSALYGVACQSANACIAVGTSTNNSLAEAWNGIAWTIQKTPTPKGAGTTLSSVACSSTSACTAVGYYGNDSGTSTLVAEAWSGTTWTIQNTPKPNGVYDSYLYGAACPSTSACTAVGWYYHTKGSGADDTLAEAWNGTASTPNPH